MKLSLIAAAAIVFTVVGARAEDPGTLLVPNAHGGYNVIQGGARPASLAFFGSGGFASKAVAHANDKPNFILVPVVQDDGHGKKNTVYHKQYFATAEQAQAAKLALH